MHRRKCQCQHCRREAPHHRHQGRHIRAESRKETQHCSTKHCRRDDPGHEWSRDNSWNDAQSHRQCEHQEEISSEVVVNRAVTICRTEWAETYFAIGDLIQRPLCRRGSQNPGGDRQYNPRDPNPRHTTRSCQERKNAQEQKAIKNTNWAELPLASRQFSTREHNRYAVFNSRAGY